MYDMTKLVPRYFDLKFSNGLKISVEPPKLKTLRKMMNLANIDVDNEFNVESFNGLIEALSMALSKNKEGKPVTTEFLDENLNLDQMQDLMMSYFEWVREIEQSKN